MPIYTCAEQAIGHTPLVELRRFAAARGLKATLLAKWEGLNPAGSVKDRVALHLLSVAEQQGLLKAGATVIEPTSGNTGIGLAAVGTARGYTVILTMPDTMSVERRNLLAAYGAKIVLTEGNLGMAGAIAKAEALAAEIPDSFMPRQFDNPANPEAHRLTTGPEIWADTDGELDGFVAGVGTGGTLTGVGEYLKEQRADIAVFAVEPAASPLLSQGKSGAHGLQGIGANFVPSVLNTAVYDEVIAVTEEDAFAAARELVATEGMLVGISSGAALWAAAEIAARPAWAGKRLVVLLPDTGDRYLSTPLFEK